MNMYCQPVTVLRIIDTVTIMIMISIKREREREREERRCMYSVGTVY